MSYKYTFILLGLISLLALGCKDKWEEHNGINDPLLGGSLFTEISKDPDLSKFNEFIVKTGYDKVLSSSKTFTVWVPTNEALASLDPAIIADTIALKLFVGNHITYQSYTTGMAGSFLQLKALNGKNIVFSGSTIDEIPITKANIYVGNGILHTISGTITPKQNIYEFLVSSDIAPLQKDYIESLNRNVFDPSNAEVTGIDPDTGKPIYKAGTDSVVFNSYLRSVAKINNEDSLYTYVILKDQSFLQEELKLKPYFATNAVDLLGMPAPIDTTKILVRNKIIRNLAFKGIYLPGNIPDSLTSVDSVKIHLDPGAVLETHRLSNGIVYVMSRIDYKVPSLLKTVIIQGEFWSTRSFTTGISNRTRRNPDGITTYIQTLAQNLTAARSWLRYNPLLNSVTYKVYMRAMRDFDLVPPAPIPPSTTQRELTFFPQRIAFKKFDATDLDPKEIQAREVLPAPATGPRVYAPKYEEIPVGEYTVDRYGNTAVFLVSNTVTTSGLNSLVLDYIKLVPVTN